MRPARRQALPWSLQGVPKKSCPQLAQVSRSLAGSRVLGERAHDCALALLGDRGQRTRRKQEPAPLGTVIPVSAPEASALGGSTQVTQARRAAPLYRPQICVITCPWLPRVRASGGRPKCQVLHARKCPWFRINYYVPCATVRCGFMYTHAAGENSRRGSALARDGRAPSDLRSASCPT